MTREEAIAIIRKEYLCVDRDCDIERSCGRCDLMMPSKEPILQAYKMAIQALSYDDARYHEEHCEVIVDKAVWEDAKRALEQEPSGDLISRQAVLDKAINIPIAKIVTEDKIIYRRVVFVDEIEQMPSAEKTEWIPVSERLPEERDWCLAVFKEKDTGYQLIPRVADYIGKGENKWRLIDEDGLVSEYRDLLECVAWMPLPEPYKDGGE